MDYEGRTGAASLWLSTLAEKCEAGEIIYDLKIKENHAADEHKAGLTFSFFKKEKAGETLLNEATINDITGDKAIGTIFLEMKPLQVRLSEVKLLKQGLLFLISVKATPLSFMNVTAIQITLPIKWFSRAILNT